jgi:hypothetical protein
MSLSQQVNVRADLLASKALMTAVVSQIFIVPTFPTEGVSLSIGESRITGSPKQEITHLWGEQVAQDLLHRWNIMNERDFPLEYWEGMQNAMQSFPEPFQVWVTKHISHFNGTNRMLSRFPGIATHPKVQNRCPNCKRFDESTSHITRCRDQGRTKIFQSSVEALRE